ncbi:MAG TPA: SPOR domain-containing protein [Sphingobium sp.]|nr:SPOR domain-containing protein [Sphingobium sp.]
MKHIWGILAAATMLTLAPPALADVKAGVDAWQQGDYDKAVGLWRPLAQAGDADAQFNMGQASKLGRGVKPDMAAAIDWYRKAAAQGHVRAEDNLGLLMFQQGERASALPYLERSAARGEPRAQYIVGTALFNGDLAPKNWPRAYALMSRASAAGLAQATASLKQMDKYVPAEQRQQGLAMARDMGQKEVAALSDAHGRLSSTPVLREEAASLADTILPDRDAKKPLPAKPLPKAKAEQPKLVTATSASKSVAEKAKESSKAETKIAAAGPWRVQLGAFSEEGRARALWNSLRGKVAGLSAYQLYLVKGGAMTRLQAGPLASNADASKLCGAIKAAGADCMPRKM